MSNYGEKRDRPSRTSHRSERAELQGLAPSQPSSFAPLLDPNTLAAQTLLMPHSDLFRLDPALAALTGQTTALGSSSAAGALLNAQTFGNPLQNQLQNQLFAQNTANTFLNSALTNPLTNPAGSGYPLGLAQIGRGGLAENEAFLGQSSRGGGGGAAGQSHRSSLRSPTDSTRMDTTEKKTQSRAITRQNSTRQLAPVFPSKSANHQPDVQQTHQAQRKLFIRI